jgi:hypothetical protein
MMIVRLRNQKHPERVLLLASHAWQALLELAEQYGWNSLGVLEGWDALAAQEQGSSLAFSADWLPGELVEAGALSILEDALNLADALERAFLEEEPQRVPASYYLFEPDDPTLRNRPGIGTLLALVAFCREGAFALERVDRVEER